MRFPGKGIGILRDPEKVLTSASETNRLIKRQMYRFSAEYILKRLLLKYYKSVCVDCFDDVFSRIELSLMYPLSRSLLRDLYRFVESVYKKIQFKSYEESVVINLLP